MRKLFCPAVAFFATVISVGWSYGEIGVPDLRWSGFTSLRLGQIVKGEPETIVGKEVTSDHVWVQEMNVGFSLESKFNNIPATGNLGLELSVNNDNSPYPQDFGRSRRLNFYPFLSRADLVFDIIDRETASLMIDAGYFPYKYNSSVRNLGEYLFRSGTYPQYLITDVDFPMARLMGLRLGASLWKTVTVDLLVTTNIEWTAIGDVNLSGLLSWKPFPLFEIGAGGSWCSIISMDLDKTTPLAEGSRYLDRIPGTGDTAIYNYTFAGQKVMGRMTLDLKHVLPWKELFGEKDLQLYTEAAVLGLIDYPVSIDGYTQYDTLRQRVPVMAGFNLPTFRFMDVLNVEVEWFNNPYPNNLNPIKFDNQPVPLSSYGNEKSSVYMNLHDDDWKWSVYGKKTFAGNFFVMFQFARDHIRWYRLDYTAMDGKEALRKNDEWYYTFKFGYAF
ncbi:MAG: hypothetical protein JXA18_02110 [Chitinispirillaceae bacterium]|nr:hypothetical protein [Chitinispirillaceae bacterium]